MADLSMDRLRMDMPPNYLSSDWLTLKHNNQQELSVDKKNTITVSDL